MASFYKRGPCQFQAVVRIKGARKQTKTFETWEEADGWAAGVEADIRRSQFTDRRAAQTTTFDRVLARYAEEVVPTKRGGACELPRLRRMREHPIAEKRLADLGPADFSSYRDERLKQVGPGTVLRELGLLSAVISCAIMDWGYPIDNPIPRIRKPAAPEHRDRRLEDDEEERLLKAAHMSVLNLRWGCSQRPSPGTERLCSKLSRAFRIWGSWSLVKHCRSSLISLPG